MLIEFRNDPENSVTFLAMLMEFQNERQNSICNFTLLKFIVGKNDYFLFLPYVYQLTLKLFAMQGPYS